MYIDSTMETQRSHIGIWSFFKRSEVCQKQSGRKALSEEEFDEKWMVQIAPGEREVPRVSCRMEIEASGAPSCKGFLNTDMKGIPVSTGFDPLKPHCIK